MGRWGWDRERVIAGAGVLLKGVEIVHQRQKLSIIYYTSKQISHRSHPMTPICFDLMGMMLSASGVVGSGVGRSLVVRSLRQCCVVLCNAEYHDLNRK